MEKFLEEWIPLYEKLRANDIALMHADIQSQINGNEGFSILDIIRKLGRKFLNFEAESVKDFSERSIKKFLREDSANAIAMINKIRSTYPISELADDLLDAVVDLRNGVGVFDLEKKIKFEKTPFGYYHISPEYVRNVKDILLSDLKKNFKDYYPIIRRPIDENRDIPSIVGGLVDIAASEVPKAYLHSAEKSFNNLDKLEKASRKVGKNVGHSMALAFKEVGEINKNPAYRYELNASLLKDLAFHLKNDQIIDVIKDTEFRLEDSVDNAMFEIREYEGRMKDYAKSEEEKLSDAPLNNEITLDEFQNISNGLRIRRGTIEMYVYAMRYVGRGLVSLYVNNIHIAAEVKRCFV